MVVFIRSPGEAVGSCQLCGQPAGKLLTKGVRGRERGEEAGGGDESSSKFHSDPRSNLQGYLTASQLQPGA